MTPASFKKTLLGKGIYFSVFSICLLLSIGCITSWFYYGVIWLACIVLSMFWVRWMRVLWSLALFWVFLGSGISLYFSHQYEQDRSELIALLSEKNTHQAEVISIRWDRNGQLRLMLKIIYWSKEYFFESSFTSGLKIIPWSILTLEKLTRKRESLEYLYSQGLLASLQWNITDILAPQVISPFARIRSGVNTGLIAILPENEAALAAGMLVWEKSLFSDTLYAGYQRIGLSHLIVVSGSNIALVLITLLVFTRWMWRNIRLPLLIALTVGYIILVGGDAPVIRAGIMGLIAYSFVEFGNRVDAVRTLLFASVILCIISPYSLLYDAGFQLSALATLGLICASPDIKRFLDWIRTPKWLGEIIATSMAASLFTLPITLSIFGSTHMASILANIVIAPFVGISLIGWVIALIASIIWHGIGYALGYIGFWPIYLCNTIALWFSDFPWQVTLPLGEWRIWVGMIFWSIDILWILFFLVSRIPPISSVANASQPHPG